MVNKEKTIQRAFSKFDTVLPVQGKKSLDECFFCLRGVFFFQFRTKDKKVHTMKADATQHVIISRKRTDKGFSSFIKLLNRPFYMRSLIIRKPKAEKERNLSLV